MLHIYPREYKKCTLLIKRWYLADAVVQDPDDDVQVIRINTKRNLGRSFDRDEVVVHIEKKVISITQVEKFCSKQEHDLIHC